MKGMKLRVCGTPIFIDIFSSLGANPQAINWSEAVTGFQQGIVDGQENPTNGINVPTKVWQWHKYSTDWHYMIDPLFFTANMKVWNSLRKIRSLFSAALPKLKIRQSPFPSEQRQRSGL